MTEFRGVSLRSPLPPFLPHQPCGRAVPFRLSSSGPPRPAPPRLARLAHTSTAVEDSPASHKLPGARFLLPLCRIPVINAASWWHLADAPRPLC
ncbi:hypothetical protein E2C01_051462 [Portunus trituberculatus]|uniref:Uncharacterized protein n=1 Tax=Portunus trituberculatus TaxID=210409 RepID=A0A5B7GEU9_PORTR|nr:hypothetical protein [Portunus trituberculatus]